MVQLNCSALREGQSVNVPVMAVVPGDIVQLSTGDLIPEDSLLLSASALFVDEAAFTGETFPVEKSCGLVPADTPLAKRTNALFMGSHVVSGTASALGDLHRYGHRVRQIIFQPAKRHTRDRFRTGHP